jgi:hypothetical protein
VKAHAIFATELLRSTTSFPRTILRVELGVVSRLFLRGLFLRVASFLRRYTALSLLPLFLPIANSIEGFIILTGWLLRRGRGSLISSSRSTGKAPAAS